MTIYALSTASGRAGVAVIRVSGSDTAKALHVLCQGRTPPARRASLRAICDPRSGEIIDRGIVLWFSGPASFTGEDMAELHVHGSRAVIAALFEALSHLGLRMAEPGEFTRRAFENGKLDLTEVEGLADLINAETWAQRKQALAQADGFLRRAYESWRAQLLRAMAYAEASLDFADEADIAADAFERAIAEASALQAELRKALADGHRGELVRDGIQVAILGAPNVGKSSILNALAGREAAIVFDEPGTTRDVIEVTLDIAGYPFVVRDTAGLREGAGAVEQEGIRRALAAADAADIVVHVLDIASESDSVQQDPSFTRRDSFAQRPKENLAEAGQEQPATIKAVNKIDLLSSFERQKIPEQPNMVLMSAKTGEGLDALKAKLAAFAETCARSVEAPVITRARHRQEIGEAEAALQEFLETANSDSVPELAAEHLRRAADSLGRLTGRLDVEDVLGQIFSDFCIGK